MVIPTAGLGFSWMRASASTEAAAGWFGVQSRPTTVQIQVDQMSVTGGIDYALECGISPGGIGPITSDVVATANIAAASVVTVAVGEPYDVCRVGLKIATNDNLDTVVLNTSDFIDITEDPGGVPKVCAAQLAAGTYTGAGLAAEATSKLNAMACVPDNVYLVTFDEFAGWYTIALTTSVKPFSILWNSGVNNAKAADTLMGFAADSTGSPSYTGAAVTHDIAAEAEKVTIGVVRR